MRKLSLIFLFFCIFLGACQSSPSVDSSESIPSPQQNPEVKTVKLKIFAMTCTGCPDKVQSILEKCHGVQSVNIDAIEKTATVVGDLSVDENELVLALDSSQRYSGLIID